MGLKGESEAVMRHLSPWRGVSLRRLSRGFARRATGKMKALGGGPIAGGRRVMLRRRVSLLLISIAAAVACSAPAAGAAVLRVGSWNGVGGQFKTIQTAVDHAKPGDWILVGPGDYKERGYKGQVEPAGVLITTPNIHLRGMDRNAVIVDGTRRGAPACSSNPGDQGALNRNGVEVYDVNDTWIENLTVCNFLNDGGEGNQIWWNGGDGTG